MVNYLKFHLFLGWVFLPIYNMWSDFRSGTYIMDRGILLYSGFRGGIPSFKIKSVCSRMEEAEEEKFVFPTKEYMNGSRRWDITTVAIAGESGELEFLKWCYALDKTKFDSTALGYSIKGGQKEVVEWMLRENIIFYWYPTHMNGKMIKEAEMLGIGDDLLAKMPRFVYLF